MSTEDKLARALSTAMAALFTYGKHPVIESQADAAIAEYNQNTKLGSKPRYVVVSKRTVAEMQVGVNELIDQGYTPHGSMVFEQQFEGYNQPMILKTL